MGAQAKQSEVMTTITCISFYTILLEKCERKWKEKTFDDKENETWNENKTSEWGCMRVVYFLYQITTMSINFTTWLSA